MARKTNNDRKSFATKLCIGGALFAAAGLAYLFLTPKTYEATVRIRLRNWVHSSTTNEEQGVDAPAQCQLIRSDAVLDEAINSLALNELWGKTINQGAPLKIEQTRPLLKTKLDVHPGPRANVIQIDMSSSDPEEAAKIANEIARVYHDKQQTQGRSVNADRLAQFKAKWEEQGKKVQAAQEAVNKLYVEISQNRTTNPAAIHYLALSNRVKIQGEYDAERDELERLKALKPEQLRQILPMLETNTSSPLTVSIARRSTARTDLIAAQSSHAADSPEVRDAKATLEQIDMSIDRAIEGDLAAREKKVESLKAAVDEATEKLKLTGTNVNEITEQDAAYARARDNVSNLMVERDAIQETMAEQEMHDTFAATMVVPEIIDSAYPPRKPAMPDRRIAAATIGAGMLAVLLGVVAFMIPNRPPPPRSLQPQRTAGRQGRQF